MELSCQFDGRSAHLLGYLFDPDNAELGAETAQIRDDRTYRAKAMVAKARELGADVSWDQVAAIADGAVVGRPHIARALAAAGAVETPADAFTADWIADGGRAFVDRYAVDLPRGIALIRAAGGVPVLAHPRSPGYEISDEVIAALAHAGLCGIEVFHPDHDAEERARLTELAQSLGLIATGGSDDHGSFNNHGLGVDDDASRRVRAAARPGRAAAVTFFLQAFVTLFVIIDPPGIVPLFLGLTRGRSVRTRRRLAWQAAVVAFSVIVAFALFGRVILNYTQVQIAALEGAGGLLLLLVSLQLLTGKTEEPTSSERAKTNVAFVPLGTPLLAGPGAIVATMLYVQRIHHPLNVVALALAIAGVAVAAWLSMRFAEVIHRVLTDNGVELLTRIAGLLLSAIAVQLVAESALAFAAQAK